MLTQLKQSQAGGAESRPMASGSETPAGSGTLWDGPITLSWVRASTEIPFANLGDALSALIVGAISGEVVQHADFNTVQERMAAIGTIIQDQRGGPVHLWGSGIDATVNTENPELGYYTVPPDTIIKAHAVRGPRTAAALRRAGVKCPPIYGDPAWYLPKILPYDAFNVEPTTELGVICHISELSTGDPAAGTMAELVRYNIDPSVADRVKIINTYIEPKLDALVAKIAEILSCRRILSSSFHGLVLPLAYGIPSLYFGFPGDGFTVIDALDPERIDHRFGDFLAGVGLSRVPAICSNRDQPTVDWHVMMQTIDREAIGIDWKGRDLFDAFPGRKSVSFNDPSWPLPRGFGGDFLF
jgi:hypothetical protein